MRALPRREKGGRKTSSHLSLEREEEEEDGKVNLAERSLANYESDLEADHLAHYLVHSVGQRCKTASPSNMRLLGLQREVEASGRRAFHAEMRERGQIERKSR